MGASSRMITHFHPTTKLILNPNATLLDLPVLPSTHFEADHVAQSPQSCRRARSTEHTNHQESPEVGRE